MRHLFFRIFVPVLAAVLAAFVVGFLVADWLRRNEQPASRATMEHTQPPPGRPAPAPHEKKEPRSFDYDRSVIEDYLREGRTDDAREFLTRVNRNVTMFVVDRAQKDLLGREVPAVEAELADRILREGAATSQRDGNGMHQGDVIRIDGQVSHAVVARLGLHGPGRGGPPRGPDYARMWEWALPLLQLGAVVIALMVVCFLLARHLSKPVLLLRAAVGRFAEGDLDQRIGPKLASRSDELAALAGDFDNMAQRIGSLLLAQRQLLQDVSHELRSPLARQAVALELAREQAGPQAHAMLDRVGMESERLNQLIGEILTLTRLEERAESPDRERIALDELLKQIAADVEFEAHNGSRSVRLVECCPCALVGSPTLVGRAIENVLRNAIRYTDVHSTVEVSLTVEERVAIIRVRDHGPGVPEAELSAIFRPFYRVGSGRDRESGGVGLGLAIAQRAIAAHGGTIVARNAEGGGLWIEMHLPIERTP